MTADEPQTEQSRVGPILKQLREKRNLTVEEVAGQMRLDPRLIEGLEADDYKIFAADTYIRGYLRNYSKLLGINGDEIIAMYQSEAPAPPEIIPNVKHTTQISSRDKPVKAFSYLITLILVLLLIIWWLQSDFSFSKSLGLNRIIEPEAMSAAVNTTGGAPTQILAKVPAPAGVTGLTLETPATDAASGNDGVTPAATPAVDEAGPGTMIAGATSPVSDAVVEAPATLTEATVDPDRAVAGPDVIYIKLNTDCWVDIRDKFDKEVYQDLARKGNEIRLSGFAPFKVELGNAQGVLLVFNNQPFDPAPVTTRGIARFTLGQSQN